MAWREGLAFSMGFPQGPLCSARPSPTLRSPSDRTLVWLPLFTLFLWEIMYYFPTPPPPPAWHIEHRGYFQAGFGKPSQSWRLY